MNRSPRRIMFCIDKIESDKAGTEKQLLGLVERLDRRDFDPFIVCLASTPWLEKNRLPCPHAVLGYTGILKSGIFRTLGQFRALIRERRPEVLFTFFEESAVLATCALFFLPDRPALVWGRRDRGLGKTRPWYHGLYRIFFRVLRGACRSVWANSRAVRAHVAATEGISDGKIRVIYNGIDVRAEANGSAPALFSEKPQVFWIAIVANLKPVKRIDLFLEGLAQLKNAQGVSDFGAVIIGEGGERNHLERMAADLGLSSRAHFLGAVDAVLPYLKKCGAAVLCSDEEGLSNAIMEYMLCGLPVVATDVGGNPELVDGSNGILVPRGDAAALGRALAALAKDPPRRAALGRASVEKIVSQFSWEKTISEFQSYCEELSKP